MFETIVTTKARAEQIGEYIWVISRPGEHPRRVYGEFASADAVLMFAKDSGQYPEMF